MLLLLEHDPPVFTIGRKADPSNSPGIDAIKTERGGDITFHGPGQLVIYPIMDVRIEGRRDVRAFVHKLERSVIAAIGSLGLEGKIGEEPGIWVGSKKVASVGLAMDDYVSYHGISINYSQSPLEGFRMIRPCGLDPLLIGHIGRERRDLVKATVDAFSEEFGEFTLLDSKLMPLL